MAVAFTAPKLRAGSAENPASASPDAGIPSLEQGRRQAESIFSALVLATNAENPSTPNPALAELVPRLKSVFGYNQFELVGSHTELMDETDEHWLVPTKLFSLSVKSKRENNSSYLLNLELFQDSKLLTRFDAKLGVKNPIFIRGPLCGKGQLVVVIVLN